MCSSAIVPARDAWPSDLRPRSNASATARAAAPSAKTPVCALCASPARDRSLLCVVETPVDQLAIEQATGFRGQLLRAARPAVAARRDRSEGARPRSARARLAEGEVQELIVATNPTVEGEATAHLLAQIARAAGVRATPPRARRAARRRTRIHRPRHARARVRRPTGAVGAGNPEAGAREACSSHGVRQDPFPRIEGTGARRAPGGRGGGRPPDSR